MFDHIVGVWEGGGGGRGWWEGVVGGGGGRGWVCVLQIIQQRQTQHTSSRDIKLCYESLSPDFQIAKMTLTSM